VGFRIYKRRSLGGGAWLGLSRAGLSVGRRGRRLSSSLGRTGSRTTLRILPGISYVFRKKR
jgi:hypothetical protein